MDVDGLVERLSSEARPANRRRILLEHRALWNAATLERFYQAVVRLINVDIPKADRVARSALWLALRTPDPAARAASLRAMGHVLDRQRRYAPALRHYEEARRLFAELGNQLEVARTLTAKLQSLIYLGRYEEARAAAAEAREVFLREGDQLRLGRLDANLGNLLHRQDRFEEAMDLYAHALEAMERIGEPRDVAIVLQNMATCQIGMGDFRNALGVYERAREYCVRHELPLIVAVADYNIAYLYYLRGEYTHAIELYNAARQHCHALGDVYREALCDLDQSELYVELNLSEEGAHLARRALAAFRDLGVNYEAAKALTNLAISRTHHGETAEALELFERARDLFVREGNQAWISTIELYEALVYHRRRRFAEAQALCESAFRFFANSSFSGKAALCQILLARIHLDSGRPDQARNVCEWALDRAAKAESPALEYQAYFVMGQIEEALGAADAAYAAYCKAHENLENLRSHLKADEMKIAFLKDKLEVYEALVRMCLSRGGASSEETAFAYIEQAKSRSLADLIAFRAQNLPAPVKVRRILVEQVRTLREELNWLTRAIQTQEGRAATAREPKLEKLRRAGRECEQKLVEAMGCLQLEDQEFASLQTAASVDLDAIRSSIPPSAMMLQYYRVEDTMHACVLNRERLRIVPLGSASRLRRNLQLLRFQLSKFRLGPEYLATFRKQLLEAASGHLQEFYRNLIAPVEKYLTSEHLIVAPHDFLHYLPFQALMDGDVPLISRHSLSYTPSASVYYLCHIKGGSRGTGSLVLGVPDASAPHIADEVRAVGSILPEAQVFTGEDATYETLRREGAHSRFIHIATHGSFRRDNPMFSSIRLGDSHLTLFDLYQLHLPAELIALSGCGTGLNVVVGGDELMGLKRGLLYAGAQCLLLTLWDVNDRSTADFMQLFYRNLRGGASKAGALQAATEELRRAYSHPFYWAPFMLVGKHQ